MDDNFSFEDVVRDSANVSLGYNGISSESNDESNKQEETTNFVDFDDTKETKPDLSNFIEENVAPPFFNGWKNEEESDDSSNKEPIGSSFSTSNLLLILFLS